MIKLNNLNKFFNRRKPNEIHVLNNVDLTLPDKGLVVLLGPSGSGKTTLLNVLGGLDKVQSGSIEFEDQIIGKYNAKTWDKIRNKHVGYVFQNYNLLTNLTVYDNIALTLNMINIYDKEEIDKRIDYILDSMGMINYRKRRASQLSGGQQQRVAIARALAKNPKIIIADEPTGNLDSKNTQEIMTILKKISQNKLVVLVTHEENIANFYGDRIIRLKDGVIISNVENRSNGSLDVRHETDIYLGDLRNTDTLDSARTKLKIFSDEEIDDDLDIRLIVKNKTIYLDVKSKEYKKMQLLESDSEINIYEGNYEGIQQETVDISDFNLESVINEKDYNYSDRHSVITIKDSLRLGWNRIKSTSRLGKLFFLGFVLVSVLIAFSIGMLNGSLRMDPDKFLQGSEDIVEFKKGSYTYDEILTLLDHETVNYLQYVSNITVSVNLPSVYQSSNNITQISEGVVYGDYLDSDKLILGREIQAVNEIVIDKDIADQLLENSTFITLGVSSYDDLLKQEYFINIYGLSKDYEYEVKVVGIVEDESKVMYASKSLILQANFGVGLYEDYKDVITITEGVIPVDGEKQILIIENDQNQPIPSDNVATMYGGQFVGSGFFTSDENVPRYIVKEEAALESYFDSQFNAKYARVKVHTNDVDGFITYLTEKLISDIDARTDLTEEEKTKAKDSLVVASSYELQLEEYRIERLSDGLSTIIFNLVVLGASAVSYFFILRSSLLSRIYEVSVYRALGVTKNDIRKLFTTEVVLITTMTSMVGYLITTFIIYRVQLWVENFFDGVIYITPLSIFGGIAIIYLVNIVAGLIPVSNLLRKTPAEILSKYDF